ncbi:CoA transferase [Hoeflea sp.]|uniref:CoA transferase n=1 Tax=Hoeflea sp. TaxID=1940281 RepID=UPI003A8F07F3
MTISSTSDNQGARSMIAALSAAFGVPDHAASDLQIEGAGSLPSVFAVSDFAVASGATAGLALAEWVTLRSGMQPMTCVDRRLASLWFGFSIAPQGWDLPSVWDAVAGDYRGSDGWIRLHTNAPHHRAAALSVLGTDADREAVAAAVSKWPIDDLEAAIVTRGGCAAAMRSLDKWRVHPQGAAVLTEPLMRVERTAGGMMPEHGLDRKFDPARPLGGVRVLDLTRVLAGPVATRFLAGFGADVLRIDPPSWDEGAVIPEVTLGKRCARLDFKDPADRARFVALLEKADVLVHGYRSDALEKLGLGAEMRARTCPGLIDVSLDAYGWSGPWANRRGFDSLVQMSSGIAAEGMERTGSEKPVPLPAQALDQGAGYLLAAAVVRGLVLRQKDGSGSRWRTSLARVGGFFASYPGVADAITIGKPEADDYAEATELTIWGPALRLRPPLSLSGTSMAWPGPAVELGSSQPQWQGAN